MLGFQQLKLINDIQRYIKNLSFTIYILIAVFVIGKIFFIYLEPDLLPRFFTITLNRFKKTFVRRSRILLRS